jgi:hypothetical protein
MTTDTTARTRVSITSDSVTGAVRITIGDGGPSLVRRERLDDRVTAFIGIDDTVTGIEILGAELQDGWDAHVDSAIELAMARHPAGSRAA